MNQQQLQGIHAACEDSFLFTHFIKKSHETHYRTVGQKKNMADIDQCEGYSYYTYGTGSVVLSCQNIDEIYPISDGDTLYFEVCIFLRVSSNSFTVMIVRQSKAEHARRIMKFKLHP